jgi:hypothetical protein
MYKKENYREIEYIAFEYQSVGYALFFFSVTQRHYARLTRIMKRVKKKNIKWKKK